MIRATTRTRTLRFVALGLFCSVATTGAVDRLTTTWVEHAVRIRTDLITGIRLVAPGDPSPL